MWLKLEMVSLPCSTECTHECQAADCLLLQDSDEGQAGLQKQALFILQRQHRVWVCLWQGENSQVTTASATEGRKTEY